MKPRVNQLAGNKSLSFLLSWKNLDVSLILNFEPLVTNHNPRPPWVIGHFQAVPFGHRSFGYVYCDQNKEVKYLTLYSDEIIINAYPKQISIPEEDTLYIDIRPTAVYLFEQSVLYQEGNKFVLKSIVN